VTGKPLTSQVLYVGGTSTLRPTVTGRTLTPPTWGSSGDEVWTVRDGAEVLSVSRNQQPDRVAVPASSSLGTIKALRLSRDGSRVAIVAGPRDRERLWVGAVIRDNGRIRLDSLTVLQLGQNPVSDVSWADSLSLVALVRDGKQYSSLYSISVSGVSGGRLVATAGLPAPPTAVAAGPSLPLLTVASGTLWSTPATDETWSRATVRDGVVSQPTYPG
jgi:hypothetical protein